MNQFNLDIDPIILLEITGFQALGDLTEANHLPWVLLVAPNIASVTFSSDLDGIDDLGKALAIIKEHNKIQ